MKSGQELLIELNQFYGSDQNYFRPMSRRVEYTPGFKFFIDNAGGGAYWLLDILATEPAILNAVATLGIVFVRLTVREDSSCILIVNADDGEPALYEQHIGWTDCPARPVTKDDPKGEWLFYFENMTIMLPGER